ncbi:MAG TPA: AI-2E family transporter, partial [Acidimicrobiales bacterium]|nr:AI-2E family transporter [Acidimicrobiales bacterium]
MAAETRPVPVRTILATIGLVLATVISIYLLTLLARIVALLVVAAFFAVVLNQPVSFLHRRLHLRRGLATTVVYLLGLALVSGLLYLIIRPLVDEVRDFSDNFP